MGWKEGDGKPLTGGKANGDWIEKVRRDGKDSRRSDTRSYIREVGEGRGADTILELKRSLYDVR